ncbi:MAG: formate/nitrite transporter family protein [Ruminococcus sp.]|nr:formate/nitrite transporter family protein [Ruminococcus sp.]
MGKKLADVFFKAVPAGFLIGIGGIVNLSVDNKYIGAFLFSLGLFTIIQFGFNLFTGKVGYIPENKPAYILDVLIILAGNICGTGLAAALIRMTSAGMAIHEKAAAIMAKKISDTPLSWAALGFFCGMLMYIAVENAKRCRSKNQDISAVFGTVLPVMVFILSGFCHSIADCFYMFADSPTLNGFIYVAVVAAGNSLGGMIIPAAGVLRKKIIS